MHQTIRQIAVLTALTLSVSICGCTKPVAEKPSDADQQKAGIQNATASAVPQKDSATAPDALPDKDANAKLVCERFLALLARGERNLAEQLLTRKALKATVDAGLELEAMGADGSRVKVGDALYATNEAKVAQVPCTIAGKDGGEQNLQWMMRRGESGWRIAGLIVESGSSVEFLSLENKADVGSIVRSSGGGKSASSDRIGLVSHESDLENDADGAGKTEEKLDSGS